eukprot:CAMPEP_0206511388 /NCGR_PEP_ID=MMETSP0324_2-20121206/60263_1 /ASSEMBLY_ACC=CAM_ASM_000836 /TAXON_ID=2866 /ORGANISM="Crypthecodinium cohnii, Strain Seligo" /LENGTH=199 /DNA_ID=CAMNT_0054003163 /DNA_START=78 /DNA_END=678 /DNA_ORIENTATION=+
MAAVHQIDGNLDEAEDSPDVVGDPDPSVGEKGGNSAQSILEASPATLNAMGMLSTDLVLITRLAAPKGAPYMRMLKAMQQSPANSVLQVSPSRNGVNQSSRTKNMAAIVIEAQAAKTRKIFASTTPRFEEYFTNITSHTNMRAAHGDSCLVSLRCDDAVGDPRGSVQHAGTIRKKCEGSRGAFLSDFHKGRHGGTEEGY